MPEMKLKDMPTLLGLLAEKIRLQKKKDGKSYKTQFEKDIEDSWAIVHS